jgi:hypothetical protein
MLEAIERFLNSSWAFGLTQTGARRRRFLVIFLGASLWAYFSWYYNQPPWDPALSERFLLYPVRALLDFRVFPLILFLAVFFGLALYLAPRYLPEANQELFKRLTVIIAVLFGFLWAFLAYQATSPDWDTQFSAQLVMYPFQALFSAHVFRHVVVLGLAFWFAFRMAALYLADIFELDNISVAERFILQGALGSQYNTLVIRDGAVPREQQDSPVIRIGGPGWVRVHLENAALFETYNGFSRVIGPTGENRNDAVALSAFERLRDVIDLRDQMADLTVEARTSDGVRIRAEDVHIVFSVYRSNLPSTLSQPYPFDPDALLRLFYTQERGSVAMAMSSLIRGELAKFISQHSLNEFLASITAEDQERMVAEINQAAVQPVGAGPMEETRPSFTAPPFITRPQMITELFAAEFAARARSRGVELKWIGVGIWVTPDEIVPQRHLEAWRLSLENLVRGSPQELDRLRRESETMEFYRLVQEVPLLTFRRNQELPSTERMRRMIIAFHSRLNEVLETLERENRLPDERARLRNVLVFLSRFTTRRL